MAISNNKDLITARTAEPEGTVCHYCGKENDFADDIGFFYISPTDDNRGACCKSCWDGPFGKEHVRRYGLGDR